MIEPAGRSDPLGLEGQTLAGRFRIEAFVAEGGFGVVYRAQQLALGRAVAIKVLKPGGQRLDRRFEDEARTVARLKHPNIVEVYDFGVGKGPAGEPLHWMALEWLEGKTLDQARGSSPVPMTPADALELMRSVFRAVGFAHREGVAHCDLKPSNILLAQLPEGPMPKVLDFGIAKMASEGQPAAGQTVTRGWPAWSPDHAAPEQVSYGHTGPATDVHALGLMLVELITGQPPYGHGPPEERFEAAVADRRPAPASAGVDVGPWEAVLARALARRPSERYPDADALLEALEQGLQAPKPRARRAPLRSVAIAGALAGVVAVSYLGFTGRRQPAAPARMMMAVLPFDNLTGDPQQEYFSDGLTEGMITQLGRLSPARLGVIGRTSVMQFKGTQKSVKQIGRELGVAYLLEASVSRAADRVRIDARLLQTADQTQVWADSYEREFSDVLALQRDVAQAIASQVRLGLSADRADNHGRAKSLNPAAYDAYLRGRHLWMGRMETAEGLKRARSYFEQAIRLDGQYAAAHAALAEVLGPRGEELGAEARASALRALELDEQLPEAHRAFANVLLAFEWDWVGAERHYRRALELDPNDSETHQQYARIPLSMGRFDQAIAERKRAIELSPLSLDAQTHLGAAYYMARRYDEAIEQLRRTLALGPDFWNAHYFLGSVYAHKGMVREALAETKNCGNGCLGRVTAYAFARAGRRSEALKVIEQMKTVTRSGDEGVKALAKTLGFARAYAALGERESAFFWLEKAYVERDRDLLFLRVDPLWDPIRADARFAALVRRVGIPDASGARP